MWILGPLGVACTNAQSGRLGFAKLLGPWDCHTRDIAAYLCIPDSGDKMASDSSHGSMVVWHLHFGVILPKGATAQTPAAGRGG